MEEQTQIWVLVTLSSSGSIALCVTSIPSLVNAFPTIRTYVMTLTCTVSAYEYLYVDRRLQTPEKA